MTTFCFVVAFFMVEIDCLLSGRSSWPTSEGVFEIFLTVEQADSFDQRQTHDKQGMSCARE